MKYILENKNEARRLEAQASIPQYSLDNELRSLELPKGSHVLDAGCGTGVLSRYILDHYSEVTVHALDYSEIRLAEAKKLGKKGNYNEIIFDQGNIEDLKIPDHMFDVVVSRYVIEHLEHPAKAICELFRVLKPGGLLYVIDFDGIFVSLHSPHERFNLLLEKIKAGIRSDLYIGRKLPMYFKAAGFRDIDYQISAIQFKGDPAYQEFLNNQQRCANCHEEFTRILGSAKLADEFTQLYLEESTKEGNALFYNKFIVQGLKHK